MQNVDLVFGKGKEKDCIHTYKHSKYLYCQALSFDDVRLYRRTVDSAQISRHGTVYARLTLIRLRLTPEDADAWALSSHSSHLRRLQ